MTEVIRDEIILIDPSNADIYKTNASNYINSLKELDEKYQDVVENAEYNTLLFADRFPFLYMMNDYSINYYAAFQGCSAETEASFETISTLTEKTNEHNLKYIMITEDSLSDLAKTIIKNSNNKNAEILELNSIQSITNDQYNNGSTYLKIMEENLKVIEKALNK